jgi:2-amino-4-hydroxy-6-hydroxymethyldihydropteridine diphosphokinase
VKIAIGLGSSLGDRRRELERAVAQLAASPGMRLLGVSRWVLSPPMRGGTAVGWFLNGVALFDTDRTPRDVLDLCRDLERRSGRRRARYWGDRTLDLDVLVAEGVRSDDPVLRLPHPGITSRPFVFWPLVEVWPEAAWALTSRPPPRHGVPAVGVLAHRRRRGIPGRPPAAGALR